MSSTIFLVLFLATLFANSEELSQFSQNLNPFNTPTACYSSSISQSPPSDPPSTDPLVSTFFIKCNFSVDCGTINYQNFDTHQPTRRFSTTARIPLDYLALDFGLPLVAMRCLGQMGTIEDMIHGVNYASAGGSRIIISSVSELGQRLSFTQQIQQFSDAFQSFISNLDESAANDLISNSTFDLGDVSKVLLPWSFSQLLASELKQELKALQREYGHGVVQQRLEVNVEKSVCADTIPEGEQQIGALSGTDDDQVDEDYVDESGDLNQNPNNDGNNNNGNNDGGANNQGEMPMGEGEAVEAAENQIYVIRNTAHGQVDIGTIEKAGLMGYEHLREAPQ